MTRAPADHLDPVDALAEAAWARSPPEHMVPTRNEVRAERCKHETPRERRETDMATYDEIAKELGTSKSTLYRVTQQLKLRIGELDDAGKAKVREAIAAMPGRPGKHRGPAVALPGGLKRTPAQRRKAIEAASERRKRYQAEEEAPERDDQEQPEHPLCAAVLTALYPDGLEPERYAEAVRVVLAVSTVPAEVSVGAQGGRQGAVRDATSTTSPQPAEHCRRCWWWFMDRCTCPPNSATADACRPCYRPARVAKDATEP